MRLGTGVYDLHYLRKNVFLVCWVRTVFSLQFSLQDTLSNCANFLQHKVLTYRSLSCIKTVIIGLAISKHTFEAF